MGFRFRKSFKVAPGVRVNVGKKSVGMSLGGKLARVNLNSSRGASIGASIPGTGISYYESLNKRKKRPQRNNYEAIRKEQLREQQMKDAQYDVELYNAKVAMLTSVHLESSEQIDWHAISTSSPPFDGEENGPNYLTLKDKISTYKPTWRDRFFNRIQARKNEMQSQTEKYKEMDQEIFNDWLSQKEQATQIIAKNYDCWNKIVEAIDPFADIHDLGSTTEYNFDQQGNIYCALHVGDREVVPNYVISLTKTGKLSNRKMAKGKFLQLYQDYVCSCVLRIGREFFSILPTEKVIVHVYDYSQADDPTDYGCILSVILTREQMSDIDFENIDCSDTIETFTHNMKFLKTKGFRLIEEVN